MTDVNLQTTPSQIHRFFEDTEIPLFTVNRANAGTYGTGFSLQILNTGIYKNDGQKLVSDIQSMFTGDVIVDLYFKNETSFCIYLKLQ